MLEISLSIMLLVAGADGNPVPKIPPGKDTTVANGPFDKDGYIDYESALNERTGKGTKPEMNANALIWKALGPQPEGSRMPAQFFKYMGIEEPPAKGDYFVSFGRYLKDHLKLDPGEFETLFDQQSRAGARPWVAADYPHVAAWLIINEKPLAVAIEATKRPAYFNPLASRREKDDASNLINCLLPAAQKCREICTALTARAMLRVCEGKTDEAWQDLLACHRLGRHVGNGPTLIESLVGIAIDYRASIAVLAFLDKAKLTDKQLNACRKDLRSLPAMPLMADKMDLCERFVFLDCTQLVRRGGPTVLNNLGDAPPIKDDARGKQALELLDWAAIMRNGNRWYDRMANASRLSDRREREKVFDKIDEDIMALKKQLADKELLNGLLAGNAPDKVMTKAVGDVLICAMLPHTRKVLIAEDRCRQIQRNLQIAFALAHYSREKGRYPEKLADLAPKYLDAIPGDVFSGKEMIYKPADKGYLFYSVGANGKDDGGRWSDDDPPGDDLAVRMPMPALKERK